MKIDIKAKDFFDKETLQKTLSTKLKKPLQALERTPGTGLPFCYEVDYFGNGLSFISIGKTNEVWRLFKTKRCKGKGEEGSIDKKKVAIGQIVLNEEGVYEFYVEQGVMKKMQAKQAIKSIPLLKKKIKDNFVILSGQPDAEATTTPTEGEGEDNATGTLSADLAAKFDKMEQNLQTLATSVGKAAQEKIQANVDRFAEVLEGWKQTLQDVAADRLSDLDGLLESVKEQLSNDDGAAAKTIAPEKREKMSENLDAMKAQIDNFLKQLEAL